MSDTAVDDGAVGGRNPDVQEIIEKLLQFQQENDGQISRPGQVKSAPSTPLVEVRTPSLPCDNDPFVGGRVPPAIQHRAKLMASQTYDQIDYLLNLPAHCQSPESYQPLKLKTADFSKNSRHALKNLSRSTPAMSPSGSPRQSDSEVPTTQVSKTNKKFRKKFSSVLSRELVLKSYACAIVSDILLQGTLYITENYFAFYSNIFGYVNRTVIPIDQVASIQKEKTAGFIPNAVGLHTKDGESYVFSSLISRDATYKFMMHAWRKSRKIEDSYIGPSAILPVPLDIESSETSGRDDDSIDQVDSCPPALIDDDISSASSDFSPPFLSEKSIVDSVKKDDSGPPSIVGSERIKKYKESLSSSSTSPRSTSPRSKSPSSWPKKVISKIVNVSVAPFQVVREGLQQMTCLPRSSIVLFISSFLVFVLLASAAFMIYKVEILSQQIHLGSTEEYSNDLYEEVLQMQQKLHSATADEVEKTLSLQIKQLATVRQSLDALVFLFNKDPSKSLPGASHMQEST